MICVLKEYEIKIKMVEEQLIQLKMTFLFFHRVELTFAGEGVKIWWAKGKLANFWLVWGEGGLLPPSPQ